MLRLLCVLGGFLCSAPPPEDAARAARAVLEDPLYQRTIPGEEPADERWGSSRRRPTDAVPDAAPAEPSLRGQKPPEWPFAEVLLWTMLGVALVAGAVWLAAAVGGRGARTALAPAVAGGAPEAAHPSGPAPLAAAEDLAARGRFGEAVHLLLLHAIREVSAGGRTPSPLPPSRTSREILDEPALPGAAHAPFEALVACVERTHFGSAPAGPLDYAACARHARDVSAACRAGPA